MDHELAQEADVVVVGAGPVGMTSAALLASYGLSVIVLEQLGQPSSEPKAISLDDESLRTYQAAGIGDQILTIVVPGTGTAYYDRLGELLFHARGPAPYRFGHPFKNPFAQPDLERVLRDALLANPLVDLRYGARVTGVSQDDASVTAQVDAEQGETLVRARFLIAADGGRSTVRSQLGIDLHGHRIDETWLVVDTVEDDHEERYGMHHGAPARPHVIVPGLDGRCRYEFYLEPGEGSPDEPPTFELMQRLLAPYRSLAPHQIERAVNYRFNALAANAWRSGRAFLAGDAAHMMPPFAGQGLNSGIRDVTNLCWKIAAVARNDMPTAVLDSYESERRPHAEATIRFSEQLGRVVMTRTPRMAALRDSLIRDALATTAGRNHLEQMLYRPQVRVQEGLVLPTTSPEHVGIPLPQPRVFDGIAHRPRMLDDIVGERWSVIGVGISAQDWECADSIVSLSGAFTVHAPVNDLLPRGLNVSAVVVDLDDSLHRHFAPYLGKFVLVRPDRLIAAVWSPDQAPQVELGIAWWFAEPRVDDPADPSADRALHTTTRR